MVPERLLLGGAAVVVLVSALAAAVVPGTVAPRNEPVQRSSLHVAEVTVAPGRVPGDTVTLDVQTRIDHRGGPAENVTLLVRAVGLDSGLVADAREVDVGTIRGEREVAVDANLTVPRSGGYRIQTIGFVDGQRRFSESGSVQGIEALTPDYARTPVQFQRFAATDRPVVEYSIGTVEGNRTTLSTRTYLTNAGSEAAGGLRLSLVARQADSNIVADRADVTVGEIAPGRTATPEADLVVPDGYNYYLDAVLWKDGVIVGTARSVANLDPTETISANVTREPVHLEVSDFGQETGGPGETPARTEASGGQPGFTAGLAAIAVLGAALLARRWSA